MDTPVEGLGPCRGIIYRNHEQLASSQSNEELFEVEHGLLGGTEKASWYGCAHHKNAMSISKDGPSDAEKARTPSSSHRILSRSWCRRPCSFSSIVSINFLL